MDNSTLHGFCSAVKFFQKIHNTIDESRIENDKAFIRQTLNEIVDKKTKDEELIIPSVSKEKNISSLEEKRKLEILVTRKKEAGEISLSKNEKAMKYDEIAIPVLDSVTGEIKAVAKGTTEEIKDYPIERFQINKIVRADDTTHLAHTDKGKTIPIIEVTG